MTYSPALRLLVLGFASLVSTPLCEAGFKHMQSADLVLGNTHEPDNEIYDPNCIVFDAVHGKVYVVDTSSNRIMRFTSSEALKPGGKAEAVFGQPDFDTYSGSLPLLKSTSQPGGACLDDTGRLWVADSEHHRILRFDQAWQKPTYAMPDGVLGQATLLTNSAGYSASLMWYPRAVAADGAGRLYVADQGNSRILRFDNAAGKANGAPADAVLGQPNFASATGGCTIAKTYNPGAIVLEAMATPGKWRLWVADSGNNRVLRFDDPPSLPNGGAAAGVLGQTNFTANDSDDLATTMDYPMGLAVQNGNLWVSDNSNNRVLKFTAAYFQANGAPANLVLGQPNFDSSAVGQGAAGMYAPRGVALDAGGRLWVCDSANDRIVYFNNAAAKANGAAASGLLGQPSLDLDPAKEMWPQGVAIDPLSGKVFVADAARHRVLRFADSAVLASGAAAEAVFGQPNFSSGEPATSASRMRFPSGLCIDAQGRLWVADSNNHRVLRFDNASSRASGVSADRVLGQANFTTMETALNASTFDSPQAVSVDSGGRLWVADRSHNRILRFDNAASKVNGAAADGVLGQPDFTSDGIPGTRTASSLAHPYQALADTAGHLWVADYGSNRVLRFDAAASLANGAAASGVLGQANFSTYEEGPQDYALRGPKCLALDGSGGLWIGDTFNYRLVRHSAAASVANGASASFQLGQQDWGFQISSAALNRFSPEAICIAPGGCLWVVDGGPSRVLRFTPSVAITATGQDGLGKFFLTANTSEGYLYDVSSSTDLIDWSPAGSFSAVAGNFTTWTSPAAVSGKRFFRLSER